MELVREPIGNRAISVHVTGGEFAKATLAQPEGHKTLQALLNVFTPPEGEWLAVEAPVNPGLYSLATSLARAAGVPYRSVMRISYSRWSYTIETIVETEYGATIVTRDWKVGD